jgi:hypothetical protein
MNDEPGLVRLDASLSDAPAALLLLPDPALKTGEVARKHGTALDRQLQTAKGLSARQPIHAC